MAHPVRSGCKGQHGDARLSSVLVSSAASPDNRMSMRVPVRCHSLACREHLPHVPPPRGEGRGEEPVSELTPLTSKWGNVIDFDHEFGRIWPIVAEHRPKVGSDNHDLGF